MKSGAKIITIFMIPLTYVNEAITKIIIIVKIGDGKNPRYL